MTSVGSMELLIIFLIAAIVVGPQNVQSVMKGLGKAIRLVKEILKDLKNNIDLSEEMGEIKQEIQLVERAVMVEKELDEIKEVENKIHRITNKHGRKR